MTDFYLIDTSSLVSLARYYSPFDDRRILYNFMLSSIKKERFIILEAVLDEVNLVAGRIVVRELSFLRRNQVRNQIYPARIIGNVNVEPPELHRRINETWFYRDRKNDLIDAEGWEAFNSEKNELIAKADFQLILHALQNRSSYTIVTEETDRPNDGKLEKKIPRICRQERIECINIPALLREFNISASFEQRGIRHR